MRPSHSSRHRRAFVAAGATLLLSIVLGGCGGASSSSSAPAVVWRQHTDATAGFSAQYPDSWNVYVPSSPGVQFLAGPDDHDFVEIRVTSNLPVDFTTADTAATKKLIDDLLAGQAITVISTTQVTYSGLHGWQYIYSFKDAKLGVGIHVHVFLFQGNRLHTIVLQALPSTRLTALAPYFDQIVARYRALPLPTPTPSRSPAPPVSP